VKELNVSKMQELDITRILIYNRGTAEILDKLFCSYEPEPHVVGLQYTLDNTNVGSGINIQQSAWSAAVLRTLICVSPVFYKLKLTRCFGRVG